MKKPLAILATVATLGATTMSAPAEAGGWGITAAGGRPSDSALPRARLRPAPSLPRDPTMAPIITATTGQPITDPDRTPITADLSMFATVTGGTTDNNKGPEPGSGPSTRLDARGRLSYC